jgi:hypothetical protein
MKSLSIRLSGVESAMLEEILRLRRRQANPQMLIALLIAEEYSRLKK